MNGFRIHVESEKKRQVTPGPTAVHESTHAVAAIANGTSVKRATIEPGPGYLGLTELSRPDPIAVAAPHADGCSVTSHDMHIVAVLDYDTRSAASAAASVAGANRQEINAVASLLEEKQTLSGLEINQTIREVQEEKKGNGKATISIKSPDGKEQRIQVQSQQGTVLLPGEWVSLSKQ